MLHGDQSLGEPDLQELDVVDVDGIYRAVELDCDMVSVGTSDYVPDAPGEQGDPVDLARERFEGELDGGLESDDVVERAGYPEGDEPIVRLVRDDEIVATIEYHRAADGGWLQDTISKCGDPAPPS